MECILLGSGGMAPMPERLLTSLVVRAGGRAYLFDCGEGAQIGLKRAHAGLRGLDVACLSHLHADHCLGLPGIMMLRAQMEDAGPLTVLGPPGTAAFVSGLRETLDFHIPYDVVFREWTEGQSGEAFRDAAVRILWEPLAHRRLCLGYRVEEHARPGRFDAGRADALGVPPGPLRGLLQRGERVTTPAGRAVTPQEVLGPSRRGRILAFATDTRPCEGLLRVLRGADLAFVEGMFHPEDARHAEEKGHMTVSEAARACREAGVFRAVLVHVSPRYREDDLRRLEAAGREVFPALEMGQDGGVYVIPAP